MNRKYEIEDILETGMEVMREQGYHNTGINDILKASGIPKGSFYNFFSSKEEFGLRLLEHYADTMLAHMDRYLEDTSQSPLERLQHFYSFVIGVNAGEGCTLGCLLNNMGSEVGGLSEAVAQKAQEQFGRWMDKLAACIQEGQKSGEIKRDYHARELAEFVHTSFFGALTRSKIARNIEPMKLAYRLSFDFLKA